LLEFIGPRNIYDEESLTAMHRNVLLQTNMVDSAMEFFPKDNIPDELFNRRDGILTERDRMRQEVNSFVELLEQDDVKELMEARDREGNSKALDYLVQI